MRYMFNEEAIKAALFSAGHEILEDSLETMLGANISDLRFVMREVPTPWDKRFYGKMPVNLLYRTGRMLSYSDALLYGELDGEPTLFTLEFKIGTKVSINDFTQLAIYSLGLPPLLKYEGIGWPAKIFKRYVEVALTFKNVDLKTKFKIQPVLVYISSKPPKLKGCPKPSQNLDKLKVVRFRAFCSYDEKDYYALASSKLLEFIKEHFDFCDTMNFPVIHLEPTITYEMIRKFSKMRRETLKGLFPKLAELHRVLDSIPEDLIPAYVSVRDGQVVVRTLEHNPKSIPVGPPPADAELPQMTRKRLHFLELRGLLEKHSGSKIIVQLYLNGPSHPKFYFELENDYASFEHARSSPYVLTFDGCFNEKVAFDAYPFSERTIVDQVIAPFQGYYYAERLSNSKILKIRMELESLESRGSKARSEFYLLAPKINNKVKRSDIVLPYMGKINVEGILRKIPLSWRYYDVLITPVKLLSC